MTIDRRTAWAKASDYKYQKAHYRSRADWISSLKSYPCLDCGGVFPPECMDFDHVRGEKVNSIQRMIRWNKEKVLNEISKCELVCANCHRTRTKGRLQRQSKTTTRR